MAAPRVPAPGPAERPARTQSRARRTDTAPGQFPRRRHHDPPQAPVLHATLAWAVERGLLPAKPLERITWKNPVASPAIDPRTVPSPDQVQVILGQVERVRPELTAFFGCLYYAALRPEEAVILHHRDCDLPATGWGTLTLTTACPRTGSAWTSTGSPWEPRGLKHRPERSVRIVPIPPPLVTLLLRHLADYGTAPDGRLFRGARGGTLSESLYGHHHTANHQIEQALHTQSQPVTGSGVPHRSPARSRPPERP